MTVLVFVKFRKDNNPDIITEEQKNAILVILIKVQMLKSQNLQPMEPTLI